MALSSELNVSVKGLLSSPLDLSTAKDLLEWPYTLTLNNGTGANQANNQWSDSRSLTTGTNENLDLAGGVTNALGATVTFTKVRVLIFRGLKANTGNLVISRPANGVPFLGAATDNFTLKPNGVVIIADPSTAGITVTAATGDLINVDNASGATQGYEVIIIGIS